MRTRFFTFQRDMRFPIGLGDGNAVIFEGKVCRNVLWHGEVDRYPRHRMIRRIFHCCCQSCLIHAIPNDFRFRCLQNDNRSVFIRHKRHWLCIADIAVSQTSRDHMRAR